MNLSNNLLILQLIFSFKRASSEGNKYLKEHKQQQNTFFCSAKLFLATLCFTQIQIKLWLLKKKETIKHEHRDTDLNTSLLQNIQKHLGHSITQLLTLFTMICHEAIAFLSIFFFFLSFAAHLPQTSVIWTGRVLRCGRIGHLHTNLFQD